MEKKEIKKVWRFYSVANYEKEEAFLYFAGILLSECWLVSLTFRSR